MTSQKRIAKLCHMHPLSVISGFVFVVFFFECAEHKLSLDTKQFDVDFHIRVYTLIDAANLCTVKPVLSKHYGKFKSGCLRHFSSKPYVVGTHKKGIYIFFFLFRHDNTSYFATITHVVGTREKEIYINIFLISPRQHM